MFGRCQRVLHSLMVRSLRVVIYSSNLPSVLASTKKDVIVEKGKDAELKKWDAETKKALAIKKGPTPLSKQEKALVDAQLAKEQSVRDKVQSVQYSLRRALAILRGVLAARVEQLVQHLSSIADCLLSGVLKNGFILVDEEAILAYLVCHIPIKSVTILTLYNRTCSTVLLRGLVLMENGSVSPFYEDERSRACLRV